MLSVLLFAPLVGFLMNGLVYLKKLRQAHPGADPSHDSSNHGSHGNASTSAHSNHDEHDTHHHGDSSQEARSAGMIATGAVFISFLAAILAFFKLHELDPSVRYLDQSLWTWFSVGGSLEHPFQIPFQLRLDPLSSLLTLVITGVGTLIHIYSIGYMSHDGAPRKYFAYLNLFCFSMLALVLGANLPILFLGWEGVGLCSYLLIGFWYQDSSKAAAGMKAFVVNRIGDLGFLIGIFLLFGLFGTLDFVALKESFLAQGASVNIGLLTVATTCLFVGAMGKSAQIPLYVWLPDAMAGPTPVSALIHAATMVTAGVYMICRLNFLFSASPMTQDLISIIGGVTALLAALIAITQTDIKKVLAYSTVSQLGYMFVGVGVGAYTAGVFHLMTHAFFKALLFLGSGSVIHGMHEEQDILKMGGLRSLMPKTYLTFAIGTLAIAGVPPLAGFWSKDEILWNAFSSHHGWAGIPLWSIGALTAFCTAFYMTRLFSLTFLGLPRFDRKKKVHESPISMVIPLIVLALLSVLGGTLGIPHHSWLEHWLQPVWELAPGAQEAVVHGDESLEYVFMAVSTLIALCGMGLGFKLYSKDFSRAQKLKQSAGWMYQLSFHKFYVDEIYDFLIVRPLKAVSQFLWKWVDAWFVDGLVLTSARSTFWGGELLRLVQTGSLGTYVFFVFTGFALILGFLMYGVH